MLIERHENVSALIRDVAQRISYRALAQELGISEDALRQWSSQKKFSRARYGKSFVPATSTASLMFYRRMDFPRCRTI